MILFINVYKGVMKEKIGYTFKIDRFEEFYVVAEVASFVGNPVGAYYCIHDWADDIINLQVTIFRFTHT